MSRVGNSPIQVPKGVTVEVGGGKVRAKGSLGELSLDLVDEVSVALADGVISVKPADQTLRARKLWGTTRRLLGNMVTGVGQGFVRNLEINGVGYRAALQGKDLVLQLGYSHEVRYPVPAGIKIECPDQTHLVIKGSDRQRVGQVAAEIRRMRPPEPYKGKGIKYADEILIRKEGKKK